jgi:hypothetical protein
VGLMIAFVLIPSPFEHRYPDHGLTAGLDGHMLVRDIDFLPNRTAAADMQRFDELREGAHRLQTERGVALSSRRRLVWMRSAPKCVERGMLGADEHGRGHCLNRVGRANAFD